MSFRRLAAFIFSVMVWLVTLAAFAMLCIGVYRAYAAEMVEGIEPTNIQEPHFSAVETKEPEVVMLDCAVVEKADTTEIELKYTDADLEMLALVIYQEAGGDVCSDTVRQMVGEVVMNRVADERFPNTIEEVLLQKAQYGRLHWTGLVWPERAGYSTEAHAVQRAYACAERVLNGERLLPEDVIWQAEFMQGTELVAEQDGFYFCR